MKRMVMAVGIAVVMVAGLARVEAQRGNGRWDLIGERTVTDRGDHDTIAVGGGQGSFDAVRFAVRNHAVDFHRVVIHFANGGDQELELRATIPAGGESRVIDIDGANRVIKAIDFWYDAKTLGRGGRALVRVMGRH